MSAITVGILGGGRWGYALGRAAVNAGNRAIVCTRRDGDPCPEGVEVTRDLHVLGARATLIVLAVPSTVARPVATALGEHVSGAHYIVHAVRGLSSEGLLPISTVVRQETPVKRVGALAGPVLASDLLEDRPSVLAVGSRYPEVLECTQRAFGSASLRVSVSDDLLGTEWASALVGALLVGVGYGRVAGVREPLLAGVMVRALREVCAVGVAAGAEERTFYGLAGIGDLMAAMAQNDARPEALFGERIARGEHIRAVREDMDVRLEPIELVPRVLAFAKARGITMPVFSALDAIMSGKATVEQITAQLMRP
ncbi:MAG: glycerol-3-phosphate dehydrogenase [Deltaproteobacteria bacterium]|nr:glycerol-3-phosphate dehydrogenase [Deltaproteobacteria bacterium]